MLLFGLIIILLYFIINYYKYYAKYATTENAYINANVIHIATQVSGPLLNLHIENNQPVKQGDLLFEIDPKLFESAKTEAIAELTQRQAQLHNAELNLNRVVNLVSQKMLPPEEKDNATTNVEVASANVKLAEAKLTEVSLNLSYTKIFAPANGIINNLNLRPGTAITAQTPLFVLIDNSQYWVDANYKETELAKIHVGQYAQIILDMYPNYTFIGIVHNISGSSGTAFALLPPQNATGNWVKVTQRVPVKILITDLPANYPLRVGSTATVKINTGE